MSDQNDVEHPTGYVDLTGDPVVDMTDNENTPARTGAAPVPPAPAPEAVPAPLAGTGAPLGETVASEPAFDDDAPANRDLRENAEDDEDPSHDEFTTVYDVIGKLEDTLNEAKGGFFSPGLVKVDRDALMANLDELKKML